VPPTGTCCARSRLLIWVRPLGRDSSWVLVAPRSRKCLTRFANSEPYLLPDERPHPLFPGYILCLQDPELDVTLCAPEEELTGTLVDHYIGSSVHKDESDFTKAPRENRLYLGAERMVIKEVLAKSTLQGLRGSLSPRRYLSAPP
jgi:hypothetical protein